MKKVLSVLLTAALMLQLLVMFGTVSAEGPTAMTVTSTSGTVGSTVTVEVGIVNNPGFHALECEIEYDKTLLELVSITGEIGKSVTSEDEWNLLEPAFFSEAEDARFIYIDPRIDSPTIAANMVTGDVKVATLTFKLLATGISNVTVNCVELVAYDDTASEGIRIIPTTADTGTVTVAVKPAYVLGDADGNGTVNMLDAIAIRRYLVNKDQYPLKGGLEAANVDGNATVNMLDAIAIRRYLVNKDQYPFVQQ